ncbi:Nucleolar protein 9 [Coemansia sp. RSA 1822]|nr:Nucleolar protein 9 [Coemansia sp. RSA 638]KAJ2538774.1 Nucleolar protein 9 [Coemansia sp. RSA 1853]KAJ2563141.1 Nucleolar protein 9 [Coemansia sp. RSA 1822]
MGEDGKRKTRRGKRGGDAKKQKDGDVATETTLPAAFSAPSAEYTAPPMDAGDSLFYFDTGSKDESSMNVDQEDKISPASYGLVNPDLQSYLKNCETMLDDPQFESAEDRIIFVNNVYAEMKGFELQLTTDHEGSRILEKLFRISSEYQIRRFFSLTREDTIRLVIHRFSSHTIQTLLLLSAVALERELHGETSDLAAGAEIEEDEDEVRTKMPTFEELLLELVNKLTPQWAFLMANEYASHILRVLLLVLAGNPIEDQANPKNSIKSKRSAKYVEERNGEPINHPSLSIQRKIPDSLAEALDQLLKTTDTSINDLVARGFTTSRVGSPVLQQMLVLQSKKGMLEQPGSLLDKCLLNLVSDSSDNARRDSALKLMIDDVVGSHFLQKVMELASPKLLQTLFERYFCGRLSVLSLHPISNFVVQSLLSNAKNERQLKTMIAEIQPSVGNLLFKQRPGVVRSLLDSCIRLRAGSVEIMNALYSGLGISSVDERKELINLLAFLMPYAEFINADYDRLPFRIQGSLIIQSVLQLPGDGHEPIMNSFFAQAPDRMYSWCKDPSGSRIIEAIISSEHIPLTTKRKVLEQYSNKYADLAVNKYGSHIVDACWKISDMPYKEKIMIELIQREMLVQDSPFGRIVMRNCRVEQYKRRADEWRDRERSLQKGKRMFKDIFDSSSTPNKRSDKKSKKSKK